MYNHRVIYGALCIIILTATVNNQNALGEEEEYIII